MKFIVKTHERVEGTYEVEADSMEDIPKILGDPGTDWDRVEQIDYMAYGREIESIRPKDPTS